MELINTKQKILDVSLKLFSRRGFTAVSVRNICKEVGIKESTIYYHFKNKRAIFNELLSLFENKATSLMNQLDKEIDIIENSDNLIIEGISKGYFEGYLMDGFCNSFIRILNIEQYNSSEIQLLYDYWMFEKPLLYQEKIFKLLMEMKLFPPGDTSYIATQYYSTIFLYFQRYLLVGELTEENNKEFLARVSSHMYKFFNQWG